jgi:hypothetical protein
MTLIDVCVVADVTNSDLLLRCWIYINKNKKGQKWKYLCFSSLTHAKLCWVETFRVVSSCCQWNINLNEPCHDKTNIMSLRPAWIRAVWSGSTLFAISFSTCNRVCKRTAWILIRLRGWSMLVANALCLFCRDAA